MGVQHSERERGSGYHSKDSSSWALWLQQEAEIAVSHYIVSYWIIDYQFHIDEWKSYCITQGIQQINSEILSFLSWGTVD